MSKRPGSLARKARRARRNAWLKGEYPAQVQAHMVLGKILSPLAVPWMEKLKEDFECRPSPSKYHLRVMFMAWMEALSYGYMYYADGGPSWNKRLGPKAVHSYPADWHANSNLAALRKFVNDATAKLDGPEMS